MFPVRQRSKVVLSTRIAQLFITAAVLVALQGVLSARSLMLLSGFIPTSSDVAAGYDSVSSTRQWAFLIDVPDGGVATIAIPLGRSEDFTSGDLYVDIQGVSGDDTPDGNIYGSTVVAAGTVPIFDFGATQDWDRPWMSAEFPVPVSLVAGQYYVVLSAPGLDSGQYYFQSWTGGSSVDMTFADFGLWNTRKRKVYRLAHQVLGFPPVTDSDGDGIPDDEDAYPNSDTAPTLIIGGVDLGVPNAALGGGATMADVLEATRMGAANAGQAQSRIASLLTTWKNAGLISGRQQGTITSAVARLR